MNWPPMEMFWERIEKESDGCWTWTGAITGPKNGQYPCVNWKGQRFHGRRWAWTILRGSTKRSLRRLCSNVRCVNPEHHLEWGTQFYCKYNHPLYGDNLYIAPKDGTRTCRQCVRDRQDTPQQKVLRAQNTKRHLQNETPEQRMRRRALTAKHDRRKNAARRADHRAAFWSPSAQKWHIWEGFRWITTSERAARVHVGQYLDSTGDTPKSEEARDEYVNDIMKRLKRLRKPMEDVA